MQLCPEYKFHLNQNILPGMVSIGKFNVSSTYLVAALSGGKVLVTNLWSHTNNKTTNDLTPNILNINQPILCLKTGNLNKLSSEKDVLFVGTNSSLLVFDVENNSDVFYKEVTDGVSCCVIGKLGQRDENVVVIGGGCSLAAYDHAGQEVLWSVTGDNVSSLAIVDVQNRGNNDLVVGSEDFEIRVFREDDIINEITETEAVIKLCSLGGTLFAYGLANGTIGVYDRCSRLWRIKSKSLVTAMLAFDINGDGAVELLTGWSNGKIDARNIDTGDVLFKDKLSAAPIAGVQTVFYPQYGADMVLVCTVEGEVRIYKQVQGSCATGDTGLHQDLIYELTLKKQNLLMELSNYEEAARSPLNPDLINSRSIPADTSITFSMALNHVQKKGVDLSFETNNDVLVRCVMIFAEGIFDGECHVVHPPLNKLSPRLVTSIVPPKDIAVDLHMKVVVGYKTGCQFHIFELVRSLSKFSMYQHLSEDRPFKKPAGFVQFSVQERLHRFILWANQNFLLEKELELDSKEQAELNLRFLSIRDGTDLELSVNSKSGQITVATDSIELAGSIVQSLCEYLNLEDLSSICHFPKEFVHLNDVITKIDGIQASRQRMTNDIADTSNIIKHFIVRAEDCRIMCHMPGMTKCYTELMHMNRDLLCRYRIRCNNHQELINYLKFVNVFIQQAGNLRAGKHRTHLVALCRQAVKNSHLNQLEKLIKTGTE